MKKRAYEIWKECGFYGSLRDAKRLPVGLPHTIKLDILQSIRVRIPAAEYIFYYPTHSYITPEEETLINRPTFSDDRRNYSGEASSPLIQDSFGVEYIVFGFGYGDAKDDYKVVRMVQFYVKDKESFRAEVSVYSLKSNSWRRIGDFPYYLSYKRVSGVLASGALHWVVSRKLRWLECPSGDLIAGFDLRSEEYRLVPQPEYSIKNFDMKVDVLGCLCMLCKNYSLQFEMWVMEDYGVAKSWTKLISCVDPNAY
ncbi:hypothetical protein LguiA_013157 [Lonicera macranthoides]